MKIKRTVGACKIFLYSCGTVMALAGVIWLIINGWYAVYFYGEDTSLWANVHTDSTADVFTPWLLMATAAAAYCRYTKMCCANNISVYKQTAVFSLMSVPVSAAFAAADLLSAKLVMQPLYGGIVQTSIEEKSYYFGDLTVDYIYALEDGITETPAGSMYPAKVMILLFAVMAVYYYCCFLAGGYVMQCFRCGRKKTLIYYIISGTAVFWVDHSFSHIENALLIILIMYALITSMLTNPAVFLYVLPMIVAGDRDTFALDFLVMTAFILITAASTASLGLKQYPSRKHIKRVLKNIKKTEVQNNDGQT